MIDPAIPKVFLRENVVLASSSDVAAFFEKRHDNVLRDIRTLLDELEDEHQYKIVGMFRPSAHEVSIGQGGKRLDPHYDMDRDGFTLLAMGFTGPKALEFKLRYIQAFNDMEATLKAAASDPSHAKRFDPAPGKRAIALMRELRKEADGTMRASLYQLCQDACRAAGIDTPPLDDLAPHIPGQRQRWCPPPPNAAKLLKTFWSAFDRIQTTRPAVNHAQRDLVAINLKEFKGYLRADQNPLVMDLAMRDALRTSPEFVGLKSIRSGVLHRVVKCWVFRRPARPSPDLLVTAGS